MAATVPALIPPAALPASPASTMIGASSSIPEQIPAA
jgi:hypothetical protein